MTANMYIVKYCILYLHVSSLILSSLAHSLGSHVRRPINIHLANKSWTNITSKQHDGQKTKMNETTYILSTLPSVRVVGLTVAFRCRFIDRCEFILRHLIAMPSKHGDLDL